jgi:hypothetical protein
MRKNYVLIFLLTFTWLASNSQLRYYNEVFTSWQFSKDSVYASNYEVLTGTPVMKQLKCDIYQPPASDTATMRPLIMLLHTGSFLPKYLNTTPTGYKDDSATIEIARGFAKRGYVVCVPGYRQGWNPAASTQEARAASIMQAVYRAEQDAKAAVRYMKKNATLYKIDPNKVVMGGQGTGGYITLTYLYVTRNEETRYSKFIGSNNQPYIDTAALGDIDNLLSGTMSVPNNPGFSSSINMGFNLGGAIGDSSWIEATDLPVIGMHSWSDPFAPDTSGIVQVPGNGPVIPVDGSRNICRRAQMLGLQPWDKCSFPGDAYTTAAKKNNMGISGYYRFYIDYPAPYVYQAAPWEWWDSATTVGVAYLTYKAIGSPDTTAMRKAKECHANGLATNQYMSKAKAIAYIDTIQNYITPRIMIALHLKGYQQFCPEGAKGINYAAVTGGMTVYPNPARSSFTIKSDDAISGVHIYDFSGREIGTQDGAGAREININSANMPQGIYLVKVQTSRGEKVQRLVIN